MNRQGDSTLRKADKYFPQLFRTAVPEQPVKGCCFSASRKHPSLLRSRHSRFRLFQSAAYRPAADLPPTARYVVNKQRSSVMDFKLIGSEQDTPWRLWDCKSQKMVTTNLLFLILQIEALTRSWTWASTGAGLELQQLLSFWSFTLEMPGPSESMANLRCSSMWFSSSNIYRQEHRLTGAA